MITPLITLTTKLRSQRKTFQLIIERNVLKKIKFSNILLWKEEIKINIIFVKVEKLAANFVKRN